MEKAKSKVIAAVLILFALLALPQLAYSGDLDNAAAYWNAVIVNLGRDTLGTPGTYNPASDTCNVGYDCYLVTAVNSCVRKYAAHLGVYNQDTIRVLDNTFVYSLAANYIEDATTAKPFKVYAITKDGGTLYGVDRAEKSTQMGNSSTMGPYPTLFDVVDDKFWINTTNNLDLIYFYGPLEGLTMTDGADTTNVLPADRNAVCDCATALVADQIGLPTLANQYWQKWEAHIIARGGTTPGRGPEVPK